MQRLRKNSTFWFLVMVSIGMFILASRIKPKQAGFNCQAHKQTLNIIVGIAQATGRLPGDPETKDPKTEFKNRYQCPKELTVEPLKGMNMNDADGYLQPTGQVQEQSPYDLSAVQL